jgi:hypothetical protein
MKYAVGQRVRVPTRAPEVVEVDRVRWSVQHLTPLRREVVSLRGVQQTVGELACEHASRSTCSPAPLLGLGVADLKKVA